MKLELFNKLIYFYFYGYEMSLLIIQSFPGFLIDLRVRNVPQKSIFLLR